MALNKVMLIGNVGKDPEIRYIGQDKTDIKAKVATFALATSEHYKDKNGEKKTNTEWHNIVAFRNVADIIERFVKKGSTIYIEGRLRTREYESNGQKRYVTEVIADSIQLLGGKPQEEQRPQAQAQAQRPAERRPAPVVVQSDNMFAPADDDLPF